MIILPGQTLGVLGSGQLGRMFAIAARQMGYRIAVYSPERDTPTGQVAEIEHVAPYEDLDAVRKFARSVSAVTFEFENIPVLTADAATDVAIVRPAGRILHTTQHRLREKTFLSQHGFPLAPFREVNNLDQLHNAIADIGLPAVLKSASFGYDGKGQRALRSVADIPADLLPGQYVLEGFIDFESEISVVAARGVDGAFAHWGAMENTHVNHILDVSVSPAAVSPEVQARAIDITRGVLESLDVVGVLCVEFFLTRTGKLLINELAPRPHNSGHLTIEGHVTSQFQQQVRAVCGLPLGDTSLLRPAAMAQLLGDEWMNGTPRWEKALQIPGVSLHLYGKAEPRKGRKMGHLTALGATAGEAREKVLIARKSLRA